MRRDPHLHDLSRDHHHALVLARRAARVAAQGSDEELGEAWDAVVAAFEADLGPHFEVEERCLLPPMQREADAATLADRTRSEHARLRALAAGPVHGRAELGEFGELLRQHVRFEEQELFPAAEAVLTPAELRALAEASAATPSAERRRSCELTGRRRG